MSSVKRALMSLYDKSGAVSFAKGLVALGVEIISTGGTYRHLQENGIPVTYISDVTGFPEILDGRVKTLHPKVHCGILARRSLDADKQSLVDAGIQPIDLVAVNLYPFSQTVSRPETTLAEALEMIDIGGPTMVRAAAKNHPDVIVVVNPERFGEVLERLEQEGDVGQTTRRALALEAFRHTAEYDRSIVTYLERLEGLE